MKELKIKNSDKSAIVDDEDYDRVAERTWLLNIREDGTGGTVRAYCSLRRVWLSLIYERVAECKDARTWCERNLTSKTSTRKHSKPCHAGSNPAALNSLTWQVSSLGLH